MHWLLLFTAASGPFFADALALYLSWYGDPTTTMAIQWHSPVEETSDAVSLQPQGGKWIQAAGSHLDLGDRLVHKALLEGLSPDTEYSFRVGDDPAIYKFRTAPKTLDKPLRFCIGGDLYQTKDLFRKMCAAVRNRDPLFAVLGGDIAYAVNRNPFRFRSTAKNQWFSFLQEWKEEMISPEGQVIPFLIVAGNHDILPEEPDLFFDLFAFPERRLYRTVDFGNYLSLFLLDSDIYEPIEGEQTEWLQTAFEERQNVPARLAVYHISAYPSVYPYDEERAQKIRTYWCPLFDRYHLPAAFENHNHAFKRTFPIRANKIDPSGVVYLGDGCWGALPRGVRKEWYLDKKERKNNVFMIDLTKEGAHIEAIGLHGEKLDSLEIPSQEPIAKLPDPAKSSGAGSFATGSQKKETAAPVRKAAEKEN